MRKSVLTLTVILLAIAVARAQENPDADKRAAGEKLLIANERALRSAVAKGDKGAFLSLVVPEGIWATKRGFVPMELLAGGLDQIEVTKGDIFNSRVTWIDGNSAMLLYALTTIGPDKQPLGPTTLVSTVWTKRGDRWLAVLHQETDLVQ